MSENVLNTRVKEVFKVLLEKRIISNEQGFADKINYSQAAINNVLNNVRGVGTKMLSAISDNFNVNYDYLLNGKGPMFELDSPSKKKSNIKQVSNDGEVKNCIIVTEKTMGGFLTGYEDKLFIDNLERESFPDIRGVCYRFPVAGFSMYKQKLIDGQIYELGYKPGGDVYTTPVEGFKMLMKGRDYVFQTVDGIQHKTFVEIKGEYCNLVSINEDYNPVKPLHLKEVKAMYLIEFYKKKV